MPGAARHCAPWPAIPTAYWPSASIPKDGAFVSAGFDKTIRVWDAATGKSLAVLTGHGNAVTAVAFSPDGGLFASASRDRTVRLWDAHTLVPLDTLPHASIVYAVAFSPDGTRLIAGCEDNTIRLWDVATRSEVAELRGHRSYVHAVAFSPDGTRLVSASGDFTVRVWDSRPVQRLSFVHNKFYMMRYMPSNGLQRTRATCAPSSQK